MRDIDSDLIAKKNLLASSSPWFWLCDILVSGGTQILRITSNNEQVTFAGELYYPIAMSIGSIKETTEGTPSVVLNISNTSREVERLLEDFGGLRNERVNLYLVNGAHLSDVSKAVTHEFSISSVSADEESATITLGGTDFHDLDIPRRYYTRDACRHQFRGEACGWAFPTLPSGVQDSTSCDHTLDGPNGCRFHGALYTAAMVTAIHPERFGAEPMIPKKRGP